MARDYIQELTDAVMFAESRGRRFGKSGKLLEGPKTKYGTAKGEMQVLDDVMRRPGYGVKPAKADTPDERARVGRDLLKAFANKYKNTETALAAYNWGPGNVDKWLKRGADFNKLPKETRNYITKVRGRMSEGLFTEAPRNLDMASAPTARAPLRPTRRRATQEVDTRAPFTKGAGAPPSQSELQARLDVEKMGPGAEKVTREVLNNLGPNYQAALAAMTLADSREDDDGDEDEALSKQYFQDEQDREEQAQQAPPSEEEPVPRTDLFSGLDIQYQSPFPEEQPVQLANGGEVASPYDYMEITPTFGERMGAAASDLMTKGMINLIDVAKPDRKGMSAAHKIYLDTFGTKQERGPVTKDYFNQDEINAISELIARKGGNKGSITYEDYVELLKRPEEEVKDIKSGKLGPYRTINKSLGQFNYELDPKTKQYRIIDEYDFNPLEKDARGRPISPDFAGDYVGDNLFDPYSMARVYAGRKMPPGKGRKVELSVPPVRRAEGSPIYGEISTGGFTPDTRAAMSGGQGLNAAEMLRLLKNIGKEGVSNAESIARRAVATVPGLVGDIEGIFRDDKARKFATTKEVEKQYLPPRFTAPTKEAEGFGEIGEMIGIPVDPTKVVRGARQAGKALAPKAAEMLQQMAPAAQPMYAVKPKGGVFYPAGSGSKMDDYLTDIRNALAKNAPNIPGKEAKRVLGMIEEKGRQYLTKSYGTGSDPIREALLQGRLTLTGADAEKLRAYALRAAREGSPEALQDTEKLYDTATRITGKLIDPEQKLELLAQHARKTDVTQAEKAKMIKEGVSEDLLNPSIVGQSRDELAREYGTDSEKMLADFLSGAREPVTGAEKSIKMAVEKGEPIYDIAATPGLEILSADNIAKGIATIPLEDLDRMSFPEMVIRGAKNTLLERSQDAVITKAKAGKPVSTKFFSEGVTPLKEVEGENWVNIKTPFAVRLEGAAMNHSIGDYATSEFYGLGGKEAFNSGKAKVFSLRDKTGKPQLTVEARNDPEGLFITQVKAPYNSLPTEAEQKELFKFFDAVKPIGFKSSTAPEKYRRTRTGGNIEPEDQPTINWAEEYSRYTKE